MTTTEGVESAAESAKTGLKGIEAKLVFVVLKEGEVKDCPAAADAIADVFDKSIVYGTGTVADKNAILTQNGRDDKIAVVAVGGDVQFTSASAKPSNVGSGAAQTECGKNIGTSLEAVLDTIPSGMGRFIVLYGDCHVDMDNYLTKGVVASLSDKMTPIVGNASIWVMEKGEIYESGKNMGLLIWGDFTVHCGMAFDYEGVNNVDAIVQKAYTALTRAGVDTAETSPDFCLINNCRGRFQTLSGKSGYAQKEADTIRHTLGTSLPFMSIYGSGEIGKKNDASVAEGAGNSISVLTVTSNYSTSAIDGNRPVCKKQVPLHGTAVSGNLKAYTINGKLIRRSDGTVRQSRSSYGVVVEKNAGVYMIRVQQNENSAK